MENQPVRIYAFRGRINVMSEQVYEQQKQDTAQLTEDDLAKLETAGLI